MRLSRIDFDQPAVVVLGAGATRGASFIPSLTGVKPPLDNDFFTQAQRLSQAKPRELVTKLIDHTVQIFGSNFRLTMEDFLTHIEHLSHVFEDYKSPGRPPTNPYPSIRNHFIQVLAAVLDESLGTNPDCLYHLALAQALSTRDTILSFNYDWLIDTTLRRHFPDRWNPRIGYAISAYSKGSKGKGTEFWAAVDEEGGKAYPPISVTLLKMHGSLNWFPVPQEQEPPRLHLRTRWWHQHGDLHTEIAPPEWNKPIRSGVYKHVWRRARQHLRSTRALIFVGYSLPTTDLPARALFMVDSSYTNTAEPLELLVIVNPDREARARIRQVLTGRLDSSTRVITFDYFKDFAEYILCNP